MLASIPSASLLGATGSPVRVEVHVGTGLPGYRIVGLPDPACRESRDRVRAAVMSAGFEWPRTAITVNLAPSGLRKVGAGLDLAIAVGVLVATEQLPPDGRRRARVRRRARPRRHAAAGARASPRWSPCSATSTPSCRSPSAAEAHVAARRTVHVRHDARPRSSPRCRGEAPWPDRPGPGRRAATSRRAPDLADVRGQPVARRALEIAAAGGHHLLMVGPPGRRQDDARPAPARPAAAARPRRRAGGHDGPLGGRACRCRVGGLVAAPAVPGAAPHHLDDRPRRRRLGDAAAGRDLARPRRRPVPRRARRVLAGRARRAPRAARGGRHPGRPAPTPAPCCRPASCSSRPPTRARAAVVRRAACECDDVARLRYLRRLSGPLLDRFDLRVAVQRPAVDELLDAGRRRAQRGGRGRVWPRPAPSPSSAPGGSTPRCTASCSTSIAPLTPAALARAARRDRARSAHRARLPPRPPGRPHDRRPARRAQRARRRRARRRSGRGRAVAAHAAAGVDPIGVVA